ncbi:hypothetical protein D3C84_908570 [compost metagenome]
MQASYDVASIESHCPLRRYLAPFAPPGADPGSAGAISRATVDLTRQIAVQRLIVAAFQAVQHLERAEGHGLRLMGADQLPEILFAAFKRLKRRLPRLTGLPLQVIEHPPTVLAGLDAGT